MSCFVVVSEIVEVQCEKRVVSGVDVDGNEASQSARAMFADGLFDF